MSHLMLTRCFLGSQNSPNDLQMLSDAPAHHLFCLLPPVPPTQNSLPEVLAVVQVKMHVGNFRDHSRPVSKSRSASLWFLFLISSSFLSCFLGLSGGRDISPVHPEQSLQREEGLWGSHSMDGVRTGKKKNFLKLWRYKQGCNLTHCC